MMELRHALIASMALTLQRTLTLRGSLGKSTTINPKLIQWARPFRCVYAMHNAWIQEKNCAALCC